MSIDAAVLWVEDNPVNQEVANAMLTELGCRVDAPDSGSEAVEALARKRFDLVLMDCQMPVMGGFEATRLIRERENRGQSFSATADHVPNYCAHCVSGERRSRALPCCPRYIETMPCAIESGDKETVCKAAHALKLSSANLGALSLPERCKTLEVQAGTGQNEDAAGQLAAIQREFAAVQEALIEELKGAA